MPEVESLVARHSLSAEIIFRFKISGLIVLRFFRDIFFYKPERFRYNTRLSDATVIGRSKTAIWNDDDTAENWILTAGKVQNLRVVATKLDGLEIPAGKTFSFWKHVGRPLKRRGFVVGREIREGCIVPTVAGGLCQLSNALYDTALKAGFQIIERHRHTRVVKGSLAEIDRDATVKWNYLDLRFRATKAFRIEVDLTPENLVVTFRGDSKATEPIETTVAHRPSKLNDCYSCGNLDCHRHPNPQVIGKKKAITTFILDEYWPEHEDYIVNHSTSNDKLVVPFIPGEALSVKRLVWAKLTSNNQSSVRWIALYRSVALRLHARMGKNVFSSTLRLDRKLALAMEKHIPIESTHVVISQNLLPFAWQSGSLRGRTFDVLMTRLPMQRLHERLDEAYRRHPQSPTLHDFRASDDLVDSENTALTKSRFVITPHREIAEIFSNKCVRLDWKLPPSKKPAALGTKVLFPASGLGRKGAYEIRQLARELDLTLIVAGSAGEYD
ncbi:MAG TPA: VanW family protein, partial [Chryseosolibacter sp.]|nr:VanW family protein [Chryseosolibacter sp.]